MTIHRNTQLDGWRALAVVGVMWFHWAPAAWRGPIPFEIGLYYFLTLTGFLITRMLLRERSAREATGGGWRMAAYGDFMKRRFARILMPCYAAMAFAMGVGASDIRTHAGAYLAHLSNFHIAFMPSWPSGTAHYWTLAIQMQFYLLWPLVVFLIPVRFFRHVFVICVLIAPLSRMIIDHWFPEIHHPGAITSCALDYFGAGALLALALERGIHPANKRLVATGWITFVGYVVLYSMAEAGNPLPIASYFQQTLLAVAFATLISITLAGFDGLLGRILNHPATQHVARLSYGLYLFHTAAPLAIGWALPWLWHPVFDGPARWIRLLVFALCSWALAWLCWRWLEGPNRLHFFNRSTRHRQ